MAYGLIDIASQTRQQAIQGLQADAEREQNRAMANDQQRAQYKQGQLSAAGAGAGIGAAIGAGAASGTWGGPVGALVGAAAGAIAYSLSS